MAILNPFAFKVFKVLYKCVFFYSYISPNEISSYFYWYIKKNLITRNVIYYILRQCILIQTTRNFLNCLFYSASFLWMKRQNFLFDKITYTLDTCNSIILLVKLTFWFWQNNKRMKFGVILFSNVLKLSIIFNSIPLRLKNC